MPKSTKKAITIALAATDEECDRRTAALRQIAEDAGFKGRYGGDISKLLSAIADLPEKERSAIGLVLKKFLESD